MNETKDNSEWSFILVMCIEFVSEAVLTGDV